MAWYERKHDGHREVRVLEVRGTNVWERVVRSSRPNHLGPGRVRLLQECSSAEAALERVNRLGAEMVAAGWELLDADAGIGRTHPKSQPPTPDARLTGDAVADALFRAASALPKPATVAQMVAAFEEVMKRPMAIRRKGYRFDVEFPLGGKPGTVAIKAEVAAREGYWRELGLEGYVEVVGEHEPVNETFDTPGGKADGFLSEVRASESFSCVATWPCQGIGVIDDEID